MRLPAGDTEMFRKHLELQIKPAYGLRVYSLWVIGEVMGLVGILSEKTEKRKLPKTMKRKCL